MFAVVAPDYLPGAGADETYTGDKLTVLYKLSIRS